MTTLQELSSEEIRNLSRETHVNLGKKLRELRSNPPQDSENLKVLQTEVGRLMRELFQYHLTLYATERNSFDLDAPPRRFVLSIEKFLAFRDNLLYEDFWYLYDQKSPDKQYAAGGALYDSSTPYVINHGWIIYQRENPKDPSKNFTWTVGDIHTDYTWGHLITSFIPGIKTTFIMGTKVLDGDNEPQEAQPGYDFKSIPKGEGQFAKPKVIISETGEVTF